jgi:hypothetical protein
MVHVFPYPDDGVTPHRVTAFCGEQFSPGELELLDVPSGMPCEACLRNTPRPAGELTDGS